MPVGPRPVPSDEPGPEGPPAGFDLEEPLDVRAEGLIARIFQHETDHLNGKLYLDRLDDEGRRDVMRQLRELEVERSSVGGAPELGPRGLVSSGAVALRVTFLGNDRWSASVVARALAARRTTCSRW